MYFLGRFVFDWNLNFFLKKLKVCIVFYEMFYYKFIWFDYVFFFIGNVFGLVKLLVYVLFVVVLILVWNWVSLFVIVYNNNIFIILIKKVNV